MASRPDPGAASAHLHSSNLLLRGVITRPELFTSGKNSQHCRIGFRYPSAKRVTAHENNHTSKETFEKVENGNCPDTYEIKEGPLDTQIRERFVEALEHSVAPSIVLFLHESPRC